MVIRTFILSVLALYIQATLALSCEELTLTTSRLELRPMTNSELIWLVNMIKQPEIAGTLNVESNTKSEIKNALKMRARTIEDAQYSARITLGIFRGEEPIGYISAKMEDENWHDTDEFDGDSIRSDQVWYSLSFAIAPRYWGRGYTTEATLKFITFLIANFQVDGLHGQVARGNQAPIAILTGLKFKKVRSRDGTQHLLYIPPKK